MSFYDLLESFLRKMLGSMVENELAKEDKYVGMSLDELRALSPKKLLEAAVSRAEYRMQDYYYADDGFAALNRTQKIIYTAYWLELEVNNGGLCQFFTNSSRVTAPFVSEALEAIGATKHKKLYDGFTAKYRIDTRDLSSFDSPDAKTFAAQYKRYPFDEFDTPFCNLPPLKKHLKQFICEHISDI